MDNVLRKRRRLECRIRFIVQYDYIRDTFIKLIASFQTLLYSTTTD